MRICRRSRRYSPTSLLDNSIGVYCLGDLVGYAPFPNEVTERIRLEQIPTIMGNYDDGVGFERDDCGCAYREAEEKRRGDQSLAWTKAHVTAENKAFLRTLAHEIRFEADGRRVLLVHGSPRKINEYLFEDRPLSSFQRLAASSNADIIVYGHTHKPYTKLVDDVLFVNVGSVGKPKDGDRRACYAILDTLAPAAEFVRVEYDLPRVTSCDSRQRTATGIRNRSGDRGSSPDAQSLTSQRCHASR